MFFLRYLAALSYDALIMIVLFFVLTALFLLCNGGHAIPPASLWYQLSLLGIALSYYYSSIRFGGQTLGMRAWRFRLSAATQDPLSRPQILGRILYFIPTLFIAPFCFKSNYALLNQWTKTEFVRQ